jgi:hypothetical protein
MNGKGAALLTPPQDKIRTWVMSTEEREALDGDKWKSFPCTPPWPPLPSQEKIASHSNYT